jgi:two-component system, NtrC family, nitrogen regulation sensor histidine kinase NtrY
MVLICGKQSVCYAKIICGNPRDKNTIMHHFTIGISLRIFGLAAATFALAYLWLTGNMPGILVSVGVATWLCFSLYHFTTGLNRKLARFFDAVRYSDFVSTFRADDKLGSSFRDINLRFNTVLDDFRQARAEKEASLQYLQTVVQQVNVGLIVVNAEGRVELQNQAALRLLGIYRLRQVSDLDKTQPDLAELLRDPHQRIARLLQLPNGQQLACQAAAIRLRGRMLHIATFQNIRSELQQKEIEAWQNLTRVLRHEIMNSVTPLVTLVGTMKAIVEEDLPLPDKREEAIEDLRMALGIVENRGRGIMRFVDAYRSFSNLPQPSISAIPLAGWLDGVVALVQPLITARAIEFNLELPEDKDITFMGDANQLEMVMINLIKNAAEALTEHPIPRQITVAVQVEAPHIVLNIIDNGPGIPAEHLPNIFIPFFTTKNDGNGIGLSLSRQIVALHNGTLTIDSNAKGTVVRVEI